MSRRIGALLLAAGVAAGLAASAAEGVAPGSYCPLPKAGQEPKCLAPARKEYAEFFSAIDEHAVDDARLARVEAELASDDDNYLALSSLAWGYYRLSLQAAQTPGTDPEIVARLERWNALLGNAYGARPPDDPYRQAVREAALDLQASAPPVALECRDGTGDTVECESTDAVVRGLDAAASDVGLRGGLERLLHRWFGTEEP